MPTGLPAMWETARRGLEVYTDSAALKTQQSFQIVQLSYRFGEL
jgi:hypothetical protein